MTNLWLIILLTLTILAIWAYNEWRHYKALYDWRKPYLHRINKAMQDQDPEL